MAPHPHPQLLPTGFTVIHDASYAAKFSDRFLLKSHRGTPYDYRITAEQESTITTDYGRRFAELDQNNPRIWELFVRYSFEKISQGYQQYSANAVMQRVRWESDAALEDGDQEFRIRDFWVAFYSRKFLSQFPHYKGFFILRDSVADEYFPGVREEAEA